MRTKYYINSKIKNHSPNKEIKKLNLQIFNFFLKAVFFVKIDDKIYK